MSWSLCWVAGVAMADPPELSADLPIEFNQATMEMLARGHAVFATDRFLVEAYEIRYNKGTATVTAEGGVEWAKPAFRLVADELSYSLHQQQLQVNQFRMGQHAFMLQGEQLTGTLDQLVMKDAQLFLGEPDPYVFNISTDEVVYSPNEQHITGRGNVFRIGKLPFFYLPWYSVKKYKAPFDLQSQFGYRTQLGAYTRNNTLFSVLPQLQLGALTDYYTQRGYLLGPAATYQVSGEDGKLSGGMQAGFISDHGDRGVGILGNPIAQRRHFIEWRQQAHAFDHWDQTTQLSWWSDSEVVRDFRPKLFVSNEQPDNYTDTVYRDDFFALNTFVRFRPNSFENVAERLPEIRADLFPLPLGETRAYLEGQASGVYLREKSPVGLAELQSIRFDNYLGIRRPIRLGSYMTITPVVGGRVTHYADTQGNVSPGNEYTRGLGQVGFDIEKSLYGEWDYQNAIWGIDGLRHQLRPILQYRWVPKADQGKNRIPQIDRQVFTTEIQPIDLATKRNIDDLGKIHVVRIGLENALLTRAEGYGSRELAHVNLYQDYRLAHAEGESDWSDFYTVLGVSPAYWLNVGLYSRFDPKQLTLREIRTGVQLIDGDKWQARLMTDDLQHRIHQYSLSAEYQLMEGRRLFGRWRYDSMRSQLVEQAYGLIAMVGRSWLAILEVISRKGAPREKHPEVRLRVDLLDW